MARHVAAEGSPTSPPPLPPTMQGGGGKAGRRQAKQAKQRLQPVASSPVGAARRPGASRGWLPCAGLHHLHRSASSRCLQRRRPAAGFGVPEAA